MKYLITDEGIAPTPPLKLTPFEMKVAEAFSLAVPKEGDYKDFQHIREVKCFPFRCCPYLPEDMAVDLAKNYLWSRVIKVAANCMIYGPMAREKIQGCNGKIYNQPRLSGLIKGEEGLEIPKSLYLVIEIGRYFILGYHESTFDGGEALSTSAQLVVWCNWKLEPFPSR